MFLKSLFRQIINNLVKIFLEVFVINKKIRRILKGNWAKFYLRKYTISKTESSEVSVSKEEVPIIWQYWESKDNTIPPLVQACLNSVEKYKGDCKRIFLNYETVKNYVELPDIIYKMKESGKMCTAHFADIVRTALLVKYGGTWIDSTVLLTDTIPKYITENKLFFFRTDEKGDLDGLCGTNYLISASESGNTILKETLDSMFRYWKENRFLVNYFSHMHIITMICRKHPELLKQIPFYSFYPVQQTQWELLDKFNEERWAQLKAMTSVHKLTHKSKVLSKKKEFNLDGTFYEHIIKEFGDKNNEV